MPLMPPQAVICNHKTLFPCIPQLCPAFPLWVIRLRQPQAHGDGCHPQCTGLGALCDSPQRSLCWATISLCYWISHAGHCNPKLLCGSEDEFLSHTVSVYYKHFRQDAFLVLCVDKYLYFCYLNFLK